MKKFLQSKYLFKALVPALFFSIGILNLGRDLFGIGHDEWHYAGDLVDTRFNNLVLENNYQFLSGEREYLFSPPFFYPAANMLAGSDAHFSTTLFYSFFRVIGYDMFDSFQLWVFVLFALNFFGAYFVIGKFTNDILISAFGAFLFTFSMAVAGQTFHIQTLCKFPIPFVLYFAYNWFNQLALRSFIGLMVSFVILFFTSIYFTLFALLAITFLFLFHLVKKGFTQYFIQIKSELKWKHLMNHVLISLAAFLLCLPAILKYKTSIGHVAPLPNEEIVNRLPELKDYFTTVTGSYWWGFLSYYFQSVRYNRLLSAEYSMGYIVLLVFIVGMFAYIKKIPQLFAFGFTFISATLLATNYNGFSPYLAIFKLPVYDHLQSPWRFYLLLLFLFIVAISLILKHVFEKGGIYRYIVIAAIGLIMIENIVIHGTMKHDKMSNVKIAHVKIENLITLQRLPQHICFVLVSSNGDEIGFDKTLSAMYLAYKLKLPCINGYTTMAPMGFCLDWLKPTREQVVRWLEQNKWDSNRIEKEVLYVEVPKDL